MGWKGVRERERGREGEEGREEWKREGEGEREKERERQSRWRGLKPAVETWGMRRQARPPPPHLASLLRHASPHNAPD